MRDFYRTLVRGDVVRVESNAKGLHLMSGETCVKTFSLDVKDSYSLFIGMNNKFEKVTVLRNKSFNSEHKSNLPVVKYLNSCWPGLLNRFP